MTSWKLLFLKKIHRTEYTKQQSEVTEKTRNSWSDNVKLFRMIFGLRGLEGVFLILEIQAVDWGT